MVQVNDIIQLGSTLARVEAVTFHASFQAMLEAVGLPNVLPRTRSMEAGVRVYHSFRGYARGAAAHGVVAFHIKVQATTGAVTMNDLNHEQRRFTQALIDAIGFALSVQRAPSPAAAQAIIDDGGHKIQ
eukprot:211228-Lingulodinium_polyedra.AAC.1